MNQIRPSVEEVKALIGNNEKLCVIPIYTELSADLLTPISAYLKLSANESYSFLFESVLGGEKLGRFSFIGTCPYKTVSCNADQGDPLTIIEEEMEKINYISVSEIPNFTGGAIGYISYDCVTVFEPKIKENIPELKDSLGIPDALLMFCDTIVVFDHLFQTLRVISHVFYSMDQVLSDSYAKAVQKIYKTLEKLDKDIIPLPDQGPITLGYEAISNVGKEGYQKFVKDLKHFIVEGDIIQAVPSQRIKKKTDLHPFNAYRMLRRVNPSPYMFYINFNNEFQLVGASPEMLVKVSKNVVYTHPIAGTRKRGMTPSEDDKLAENLLADLKERSEHIMLVDLGRNDVNRICDPNTVKVDSLMHIERYSHVMHLVSNVSGTLRPGKTSFDAFRSVFPAGTVSGAPKIRAMQIVYSLEKEKRGIYAGSVGYFSFDGDLDTCIAIRTMLFKDQHVYLQAGGGIVYDSVPEDEYEETLNKLRSNVTAIEKAENFYYNTSNPSKYLNIQI